MSESASGKGGTARSVSRSDRGAIKGQNNSDRDWMLAMQQKYPTAMDGKALSANDTVDGQSRTTLPGEYAYPTHARDRFLMKQKLKESAALAPTGGTNQVLNWSVGNDDMDVMMDLEKARRTYEFHLWIEKHIDIRKPGNLRWIQEVAPDFLSYKMNALDTSLKLAKKKAEIEALGIQSEEDLKFKFMVDNDMLRDGREANDTNRYVRGFFNPAYNIPGKPSGWTSLFQDSTTSLQAPAAGEIDRATNYFGGIGSINTPGAYDGTNVDNLNQGGGAVNVQNVWSGSFS